MRLSNSGRLPNHFLYVVECSGLFTTEKSNKFLYDFIAIHLHTSVDSPLLKYCCLRPPPKKIKTKYPVIIKLYAELRIVSILPFMAIRLLLFCSYGDDCIVYTHTISACPKCPTPFFYSHQITQNRLLN